MRCSPGPARFGALALCAVLPGAVAAGLTLNDGLVGHWKLDETAGERAADSSACRNHGLIQGATPSADRHMGGAFHFDGTDDYVRVRNSRTLELTGELTIAFWIKSDGLSYGQKVLAKRANDHSRCPYEVQLFGDGKVRMNYCTAAGEWVECDSKAGAVVVNRWRHVAITRDAAGAKAMVYVDGKLNSTVPVTGLPASNGEDLVIGHADGRHYSFFKGDLDEVRLYDRELSAAEIQQLLRGPARPAKKKEKRSGGGKSLDELKAGIEELPFEEQVIALEEFMSRHEGTFDAVRAARLLKKLKAPRPQTKDGRRAPSALDESVAAALLDRLRPIPSEKPDRRLERKLSGIARQYPATRAGREARAILDRFTAAEEKEKAKFRSGAEGKAQAKLRMARNFARNKMRDRALELLKEIVEKFPDTEAAAEAEEELSPR